MLAVIFILCVIIFCDYLSLRQYNNKLAKRLGYDLNWRSMVDKEADK